MEMLINVGIIIGILIIVVISIKLLILIISSVLCVWAEFGDCFGDRKFKKKKEKQCEQNSKKVERIMVMLEDFLSEYDLKIPSDDREGNEDEACIYGRVYYDLEDRIFEILDEE